MANRMVQPIAPHSIEAEESVLGSILISQDALNDVAPILKTDDFFEVRHGWIWDAIMAVAERNEAVDNLTVVQELRNRGKLDEIGGPAYITYLINGCPTHLHAETYAHYVERVAVRRKLMEAAGEIAQLARSENREVTEVVDAAEAVLYRVTHRDRSARLVTMHQSVRNYYERLEMLQDNRVSMLGIPTGFDDLDHLIKGLQRGKLYIVGGRPGTGKTSFMLNIARTVVGVHGLTAEISSLEMGEEELQERLMAVETGINSQRLQSGELDNSQWGLVTEATLRMQNWNLFIDDTALLTITALRRKCRKLAREHRLDLIVVDYLQLMSSEGSSENRNQEVSAISRGLKLLARELNVPVLAAAQLSRKVEDRADKRPMLSDLRDSGAVEQDADVVLFLYRDELYNENTDRPNQAEVIIAKNRSGPTGVVTLYFRKDITQFVHMTRKTYDLNRGR